MREIKFRGKDLDSDKWKYGQLTVIENDYFINYEDQVRDGEDSYIDYIGSQVKPETVGQYIGKKDKNGKEIYDGDIIKYGVECEDNEIAEYIGRVYFNINEASFCIYYNSLDGFITDDYFQDIVYSEVIANIHDNPEFLKNGYIIKGVDLSDKD